MELEPAEGYECRTAEYSDPEKALRDAVLEWLRERVELAAPGIKFPQDYESTPDQQRLRFLCGIEHRAIMPGDKNQQRGDWHSTPNIFNKAGCHYLSDALESGQFRSGLAALWPGFRPLRVALGQWWLSFSPSAPIQRLVVDERGQLIDATQYMAVLRPASRHTEEDDVDACLPTQCDLALWWHTGTRQLDEGHTQRTLALSYANTCVHIDVDDQAISKLPVQPQYFALRHCAIIQRLVK